MYYLANHEVLFLKEIPQQLIIVIQRTNQHDYTIGHALRCLAILLEKGAPDTRNRTKALLKNARPRLQVLLTHRNEHYSPCARDVLTNLDKERR